MGLTFIDMFNACGNVTKDDFIPMKHMKTPVTQQHTGLDSLDMALFLAYMADLYGAPDSEDVDQWPLTSIQDLKDHIMTVKTLDPEKIYDTMEAVAEAVR